MDEWFATVCMSVYVIYGPKSSKSGFESQNDNQEIGLHTADKEAYLQSL